MKKKLSHRHFAYTLLAICALEFCFIAVSAYAMLRFANLESKQPEQIGVTFSQVQAQRFGSDWKSNYLALLDDLKFKHIRIIAYWDRVEPNPNQFDFSELDWMVAQAKTHHATVTIALGQRVLRYPECFYPSWVDKNDTTAVNQAIDPYITTVARHFYGNSSIDAWQLENEFLLHAFGQCPNQNLTKKALSREIATLRAADSTHPIVITASDEFGLPLSNTLGDIYGLSMYKTVWNQLTKNGYFTYPQPGLYNLWRAGLISLLDHQQIRIHELQAEPWGPVGNENLPPSEAAKSMSPEKLRANIAYARSTHIRAIDLWGAEWWYWLKNSQGDNSMWEAARAFAH